MISSTRFALALLVGLALATSDPSLRAQPLNAGLARMGLNLRIPPLGTGGSQIATDNTISIDLDVAAIGTVTAARIGLNLEHTFVGDLVITLSHQGTTVVLSDGIGFVAPPGSNLLGYYEFADAAGLSINAAPELGGNLLQGTYRPDTPLSAFAGANPAGRWTLTIIDRAGGDVGILRSVGLTLDLQTISLAAVGLGLPLPPIGTGGQPCGSPLSTITREFVMPPSGRVGAVGLDIDLIHTFASDLIITISHQGVTQNVLNRQGANNDLVGTYRFREGFPPLGASTTTSGTYGFVASMEDFHGLEIGGVWTVTICDVAAADVGLLNSIRLSLVPQAFDLDVLQPQGPTSIDTRLTHGSQAFNSYFSPFTGTQGSFPMGWFYGIDASIPDLLLLYNSGLPIVVGNLDVNGSNQSTLSAPIPSGLPIYLTSLDLRGSRVAQQATPLRYVTR